MPTPSAFAKKLASIALAQHDKFQFTNEADPTLCKQIKKWTEDIGFAITSCTRVPWSAVFISWCVKQAGASKAEFKFAMAHSVFVNEAIKNAVNGTGSSKGSISVINPQALGISFRTIAETTRSIFAFAKTHKNYESHSVIVIEIGQDAGGGFAFCIGGNESDSVRRSVVRLDSRGFIKRRDGSPFICVIKDLK